MKTIGLTKWTAVCLSALTVNAMVNGGVSQSTAADKQESIYTGTVAAVDSRDHTLKVAGVFMHKDFNLANTCRYALLNSAVGDIGSLRPGEKVSVAYQNIDGVRVADYVEQQPMIFEGRVSDIDAKNRTMSVRHLGLENTFQIAPDCAIMLYNGQTGTPSDLHPGNLVAVTYESPAGGMVARRIVQTSQIFTGEVTAIDLNDRIATAKDLLARKKFNVAANCAVILNGKTDAGLQDVKLGERLEFAYTDVNGVNIVNRIEAAPQSAPVMSASSAPPHEYLPPGVPDTGY